MTSLFSFRLCSWASLYIYTRGAFISLLSHCFIVHGQTEWAWHMFQDISGNLGDLPFFGMNLFRCSEHRCPGQLLPRSQAHLCPWHLVESHQHYRSKSLFFNSSLTNLHLLPMRINLHRDPQVPNELANFTGTNHHLRVSTTKSGHYYRCPSLVSSDLFNLHQGFR